jgi:hypothetical protein
MKRLSSTLTDFAVIAAASAVLCGCAGTAPLKGGKATTLRKPTHGIEQTVVQSDNPAAVSRQDQETVRTRSRSRSFLRSEITITHKAQACLFTH